MAKEITGTVLSNKMAKTVVVMVERKLRHPLYRKVIVKHKKIKAHSENPDIKVGDIVTIMETRPISKDKHFIVISPVKATKEEKKEKVKTKTKK
jgi:small subunit ribosomal protein S17